SKRSEMTVGHKIARRFPALDVSGRNRPGGASQITETGDEFQIDRRSKKRVFFAPGNRPGEFFDRRPAGQEEVCRMHSWNTPSRSTMMSWVFSRPSRCTFQYIQPLGAITGLDGSFGPFLICAISFGVSNFWAARRSSLG